MRQKTMKKLFFSHLVWRMIHESIQSLKNVRSNLFTAMIISLPGGDVVNINVNVYSAFKFYCYMHAQDSVNVLNDHMNTYFIA